MYFFPAEGKGIRGGNKVNNVERGVRPALAESEVNEWKGRKRSSYSAR